MPFQPLNTAAQKHGIPTHLIRIAVTHEVLALIKKLSTEERGRVLAEAAQDNTTISKERLIELCQQKEEQAYHAQLALNGTIMDLKTALYQIASSDPGDDVRTIAREAVKAAEDKG